MSNVIELKKINKEYGKKVKTKVLFDIDLVIKEKEFVSIIGQSGSGKSTLLNIMGLLDLPTSGEVLIDNISDIKNPAIIRNEKIGFIFQFHFLLPEYNVIDNVLMPIILKKKKYDKEDKKRALDLLELVEIKDKSESKISELSGGQMQRVAIARALINEPKVILADEPTGSLDSATTESIYKLFRKINKELKTTFVIITHDYNIAKKTDRIIKINDGIIEMDLKNS